MKLSTYLSQDVIKNKINEVVGGKNGQRFISAIVSATTQNPQLQACDNGTILSAALLGEGLNLSPSPQLGQYYMVPYDRKFKGDDEKWHSKKEAQFQLGYKGYIQLAIRSGYYKKLNVLPIKEGELINFDPLTEEIVVNLIEDTAKRESAQTIGYYAMFEYLNGFKKAMYWSKEKMKSHAERYSQGYAADLKKGTSWTFWSKDFDGMACKTMLRQLISKWGIMSVELQTAYENDMGVIREDGSVDYVDNEPASYTDEQVVESTAEVVEETAEPEEVVNPFEQALMGK